MVGGSEALRFPLGFVLDRIAVVVEMFTVGETAEGQSPHHDYYY